MKLVTGETMAEIDRRTIEEAGIPGAILMEKAGLGVADCAEAMLGPGKDQVMILCGSGNNGGDGFVAARLLAHRGYLVHVFLVGEVPEEEGEAAANYRILGNIGLEVIALKDDETLWQAIRDREYDLIIDALLGTGLKGEVRGIAGEAISFINSQETPVLSVDIPSGLDSTTGRILGQAVEANVTVTFGLPKIGLQVYPGCVYSGKVEIIDIGIPHYIVEEAPTNAVMLEKKWACQHYPRRSIEAYKGSCGRILIVGGSRGMTGAPLLAAQAAFRSGAGVVTLGVPASLNDIIEIKATEVISCPLSESTPGLLGSAALEQVMERSKSNDFLVLGPGLGGGEGIEELVAGILKESHLPVILDADGINALPGPRILKDRRAKTILTPHYGEMARLLGVSKEEVLEVPFEVARAFAREWEVILVLKGPHTLVALPDGNVFVNTSGNPGLATAGAGDVLTGVIAGIMGQNISLTEAVAMGVYLHGRAGDLAVAEKGIYGINAGDLVEFLAPAWKEIQED